MNYSFIALGVVTLTLLLAVSAVVSGVEPSSMSVQLKAPNSSHPYEDQSFLERADYAILNLTSHRVVDSELMELQSVFYSLVKKNVSPQLYGEAKNITKFLYYDMKAAEEMQDYKGHSGAGHIYMDAIEDVYDQAAADQTAAEQAWRTISHRYPQFKPSY